MSDGLLAGNVAHLSRSSAPGSRLETSLTRLTAIAIAAFLGLLLGGTATASAAINGFNAADGNQVCAADGLADRACPRPGACSTWTTVQVRPTRFSTAPRRADSWIWSKRAPRRQRRRHRRLWGAAVPATAPSSFLDLAFHREHGDGNAGDRFELNQSTRALVRRRSLPRERRPASRFGDPSSTSPAASRAIAGKRLRRPCACPTGGPGLRADSAGRGRRGAVDLAD